MERLEPALYEQDGFVTTWQALQLGCDRNTLVRLVAAGRLERLQQGVYRSTWGPAVMARVDDALYGDYLALDGKRLPWDRHEPAVVISHASAADLLMIGTIPADVHEFTSAQRRVSSRPGIRLWSSPLPRQDYTWLRDERVPVTTAARTIVDMALARVGRDYIERMVADARRRQLIDPVDAADVVARRLRSRAGGRYEWLRSLLGVSDG